MITTIFSKILAEKGVSETDIGKGTKKEAGTIEFGLRDIEWDNQERRYDIFDIPTTWGSLNLIKNEKNTLLLTTVFDDLGTFATSAYVGNFVKGSRHHIAITWSRKDREIKLYLDGKLSSTTKF